ncbi:unnamed protein product [Closterium sp. NIES-53]
MGESAPISRQPLPSTIATVTCAAPLCRASPPRLSAAPIGFPLRSPRWAAFRRCSRSPLFSVSPPPLPPRECCYVRMPVTGVLSSVPCFFVCPPAPSHIASTLRRVLATWRSSRHSTSLRAPFAVALCRRIRLEETFNAGRPGQTTPTSSPPCFFPSRPCSPSPAVSDVIRGASGQDVITDVPATPAAAVATAIVVGTTFAFNFTAARCTNLPSTASSASVQWTSAAAATAKLPACENVTFLTGPDCTGVVASSVAKPSSAALWRKVWRGPSLRQSSFTRCLVPHQRVLLSLSHRIDHSLTSPCCSSRALPHLPVPSLHRITWRHLILVASAGDAPWWPTEVPARVVVATAVTVGAYKVAFDPSSRCAGVPAGTAPAGVSTPVSVQWGSSSSLAGGGASAPCNLVSFFPGTNCDGAAMQHFYSSRSVHVPGRGGQCRGTGDAQEARQGTGGGRGEGKAKGKEGGGGVGGRGWHGWG